MLAKDCVPSKVFQEYTNHFGFPQALTLILCPRIFGTMTITKIKNNHFLHIPIDESLINLNLMKFMIKSMQLPWRYHLPKWRQCLEQSFYLNFSAKSLVALMKGLYDSGKLVKPISVTFSRPSAAQKLDFFLAIFRSVCSKNTSDNKYALFLDNIFANFTLW